MTTGRGPRRDLVGYGRRPPQGTWPGGARVALNVVVNVEEGSERSMADGDGRGEGLGEVPRAVDPNYRDLGTESVYEYGSRAGIFRLLRLFDRLGVRTTAFAAAMALERNPDAAAWLVESGHEVCAHGYRWSEAWTVSREEEAQAIAAAVESITATCGQRPLGWYSRWMPSIHTRQLLMEEGGFLYDADAYNDDIPYYAPVEDSWQLVVPYSMTYNDSFYHYGHLGGPSDFVDYCRRALDYLAEEDDGAPRLMSVGLHPRLSGQAARASALAEFLEHATSRDDVWVTTRLDIARYWREHFPPPAGEPEAVA
ncbi:polysaccharide deacetylase family protein [Actinoallomurus sp. NBC_01490]|uniref:polysaccharide deacetylase family protein n=1 Tax=Actinoallomurus sp. NBC_01490 TaxID=2903557 RepID=UPI002E35473E|nr:polysaccharide deacetylase family protein [Actinoallomurus sp. NBC_01490]